MAEAALELAGIVKQFGGARAVDDVSLSVAPGEVLALVGENGAGKSTLISVACGLYTQDRGEVRMAGRALPPGDPRAAIDAGLGAVHQHFMLVGPLTVWENVVLGREPRRLGVLLDRARARREVREAAERSGLSLDVDARIEALGVGAQQRVEIVKQLWRGARVLILDEPTAVLSPGEADDLVRTARALAAGGRSVVFISHKLREVLAVADRIAVLRRGKLVQVGPRSACSAESLAEAVMGKPITQLGSLALPAHAAGLAAASSGQGAAPGTASQAGATPAASPRALPAGPPPPTPGNRQPRRPVRATVPDTPLARLAEAAAPAVLEVRDLSCASDRGRPALAGLSFAIQAAEIVGVAGVDGNGQGELAEVLTGLRQGTGTLRLSGDDGLGPKGWARSAGAARAAGVVHLPEDRHRRALCLPLSVEENLALGHHRDAPYARGAWIDRRGRRARAIELVQAFDVRPPDPSVRAGALSGGNQQKLVAARELAGGAPPKLVIAVQPTRGLDLGAARRVHDALRAVRDGGAAVLVISLDLDELRALSDRLLVLYGGRAMGVVSPSATDEQLGRLMLGQEAAHG